ncbi:MAG: FkbM family methyltransferase [Anaerolineae bacterium]|nr:FkbM family methyltransferase [Anaerolineae bacterium]
MKIQKVIASDEIIELRTEGASTPIDASLFHLSVDDRIGFDLYVNAAEPDAITQSIVNLTFVLPENFALLKDLIQPGSRVLDLGAHIGTFSLYAAAAGYCVLSVEASPSNVALFKQSLLRNKFDSVKIVETAVSDYVGTAEFIVAGPHSLLATPLLDNPRITVPVTTVGDILRIEGWDAVDFIKMDIEGAEVAAIRGMTDLLSTEHAPTIFYESNGHTLRMFDETPGRLMSVLEGFGYRCYLVEENRLIPYHSADLQTEVCVDYLATKHPLHDLSNWKICPPLSVSEKIDRALQACTHPHQHMRAYIVRALADTDAEILADQRIKDVLEALKYDVDADVREAASWVKITGKPVFERLQELQRALVEKDAEIACLKDRVEAYERGKFIRLMRFLSNFWRKYILRIR